MYGLGKLEISLAEGFTPEPGRKYLLMQYGGELQDEFDNVPQGGTLQAEGGTTFTIDTQDGGTVSLKAEGDSGGRSEPGLRYRGRGECTPVVHLRRGVSPGSTSICFPAIFRLTRDLHVVQSPLRVFSMRRCIG